VPRSASALFFVPTAPTSLPARVSSLLRPQLVASTTNTIRLFRLCNQLLPNDERECLRPSYPGPIKGMQGFRRASGIVLPVPEQLEEGSD